MRLLSVTCLAAIASAQQFTTSLFVPQGYVSNTFRATILGTVNDASATTYAFSPGCERRLCSPVTVIQGPGTAIFSAPDGITTIWDCKLSPESDPTSASCLLTSTSPGYSFPGTDTKTYPVGPPPVAFPTFKVVVVEGSVTGGGASTTTSAGDSASAPLRSTPGSSSPAASSTSNGTITPAPSSTTPAQTGGASSISTTSTPSSAMHLAPSRGQTVGVVGAVLLLASLIVS